MGFERCRTRFISLGTLFGTTTSRMRFPLCQPVHFSISPSVDFRSCDQTSLFLPINVKLGNLWRNDPDPHPFSGGENLNILCVARCSRGRRERLKEETERDGNETVASLKYRYQPSGKLILKKKVFSRFEILKKAGVLGSGIGAV